MKKAYVEFIAALILNTPISATTAQSYEPCEKYEYAELKALTQKQLQAEYCKVARHTNDIYKAIGYASADHKNTDALIRERNNCWQAAEKMGRQPLFKTVKKDCPDLAQVAPLDAALEKARENLEKARARNR